MVLVDFKGYFQGPIWTFVIYLGQYLRNGGVVTNVCMKPIYKVIYELSVDLVMFDLGLPLKVKSRLQTFKELCLINCASYDHQSLYQIHIASHIWRFSLPYDMYDI